MADDKTKDYDKRLKVDVDLDFPVTVADIDYIKLTMRRPKMKDSLKAAEARGSDVKRSFSLFADLCDVAPDVIGELDEIDMKKLTDQLDAFRGGQAEA